MRRKLHRSRRSVFGKRGMSPALKTFLWVIVCVAVVALGYFGAMLMSGDGLPQIQPDVQVGSNDNTPTPDTGNNNEDTQPTINNTIPELALPVSGKLIKHHSVDVQVFSQTLQEYRTHLGIDIATAAGAEVCAVADGTVSQIWEDPLMGWCVALTHAGDCVTVYKNLAKDMAQDLAVNTEVKKGQLLGYVGDSAIMEIAEEPHLHMEMTVKGLQVDPLDHFSAAVIKTLSEDTIYEQELGK